MKETKLKSKGTHVQPLPLLLIFLAKGFDPVPNLLCHEVQLLVLSSPHLIPVVWVNVKRMDKVDVYSRYFLFLGKVFRSQ